MALMSESKKGKKNGMSTQVMGSAELGQLLGQVHGCGISWGNELQRKYIPEEVATTGNVYILDQEGCRKFFNGDFMESGMYIMTDQDFKGLIKEGTLKPPYCGIPDFTLLEVLPSHRRVLYTVELKANAGHDFTASKGIKDNLEIITDYFHKLGYNNMEAKICGFYGANKAELREGFKNKIELNQIWTGLDFCNILGINYAAVANRPIKAGHQDVNLEYFCNQLREIQDPRIRCMLGAAFAGYKP